MSSSCNDLTVPYHNKHKETGVMSIISFTGSKKNSSLADFHLWILWRHGQEYGYMGFESDGLKSEGIW